MKRTIVVLLALILSCSLTGCMVNSTSRPTGEKTDLIEVLNDYAGAAQPDAEFVRSLAVIPKTVFRDPEPYADWQKTVSEDGASTAYENDRELFGCSAHITLGIQNEKSKVSGITVILTTGDPVRDLELAKALYASMLDTMGGSYECYIDGVSETDKKVQAAFEEGDPTRSLSGIWPKSSVKWSAMVRFDAVDGQTQVGIYVI